MEENPQRNVGRSQPVSESDFVPTPRKLVPTTVITRSGEVCQPWSLVTRRKTGTRIPTGNGVNSGSRNSRSYIREEEVWEPMLILLLR